ncbi:redoxin [Aliidiomarina iranensis]|uniref:Redoxin n=1 Tax=Aliidiomarina iranensis TaxID=1434071 RepID=A0A432VZN5_9GAMM|nr:TlpA disulfide reductase family protein [Aliidiomarina iranensis]RUO22229.1 redoxin [Aliidiomarina iranensis]
MSVSFGPFAMGMLQFIFVLAVVVTMLMAWLVSKKYKVAISDSVFHVLAVGILVARISFIVRYFELYAEAPWQIINIRDGGFDLWAGVVGSILMAVWEISRNRKIWQPLTIACVSGAIAYTAMNGYYQHKYGGELFVPNVQVQTLDDRTAYLNREYLGQPMVVNLWATWCPPCVREMPLLEDAQAKWPDVAIVTVNQGDTKQQVLDFVAEQNLNLTDMLLDHNNRLSNEIGSFALPTTLFFNAEGMLIDTHVGEFSPARLQQAIELISSDE